MSVSNGDRPDDGGVDVIDATVVIASYETRSMLLDCLASVGRAEASHPSLRLETIVVDNGSSDGSAQAVREQFPEVRLIARVRNRGFASAMNCGMRAARGRTTILLNSDVEVDGDLFVGGIALIDQHPDIGVVGPKLLHPDGRAQRSVHRRPGWRTEFWPFDWVDRFKERVGGSAEPQQIDVEAVRGAVLFLRSAMFENVGFLNEAFFFFLEETEFCARARRAGYRVVWAPQLKAVHRLGESSKKRAPAATRIEFHRSLYRYLSLEKGRSLALAAKCNRTLRTGLGLLVQMPLLPVSKGARRRFAERGSLFLWHLRGCPETPGLAQALENLD